ncbi:MAG: single-stranded DNA-binding protein [Candidatus Hydrogenedentes bacterium]|jgi:single-strand DNA-binding protein|nr:single-stranded DNA-binding protein [Candidatus Hydrogenedentota bacterium]
MSDLKMPDLNRVFLAGRLTRDPDLRYLPSGSAVCTMGLAVSRRYRTKEGEQREDTMFINVETWNKSAEYCNENLQKGRPILVEGSLKMDEWEDKTTGQKRTVIKVNAVRVHTLDWEDRGGGGGGGRPTQSAAPSPRPIEEPVPEDDIPF